MKTRKQSLLGMDKHASISMEFQRSSIGLTFTSLNAVKPPVLSVSVAGTSTMLVPSTARSATADSTGFIERATLRTRYPIARGDG